MSCQGSVTLYYERVEEVCSLFFSISTMTQSTLQNSLSAALEDTAASKTNRVPYLLSIC